MKVVIKISKRTNLRARKEEYYRTQLGKDRSNMKEIWSFLNSIIKKNGCQKMIYPDFLCVC